MTKSLWQRLRYGTRRVREQPDWAPLVGPDWAEHIMTVAVTDQFHAKQGRSTGRWIVEGNGRRLVVYLKRHYRLEWWRGLLATIFSGRSWSPAMQEWEHLDWARAAGFPVPRAVAASERIGPWGRLESFLAVEELADMLPLHQAIPLAAARLDPDAFCRWKEGLIAELARLTRALHDRRRFHKDLYLCHFFIPEKATAHIPTAWAGRVHMIDLHRLGHHPWTGIVWQVKDLAQLLFSTDMPGVTDHDRQRFWTAYTGTGKRIWLRRAVALKAWRYGQHNRKGARKTPETAEQQAA